MIHLALVLLATLSVSAQSLPWIDLSGEWRIHLGDDQQFADPEYDDARWDTLRLPGTIRVPPGGFYWLRRSVELPPELDRAQLALTLGKLTENYELFVNGKQIWSSGFTVNQTQLARPRTFDLPQIAGSRLHIAVRGWSHHFFGSTGWRREPDTGPYLLTAVTNAPRIAERAFVEHLRMQRTLDLAVGVLLLTLSVILLLMFARDLSRRELLWLAVCCGLVAWTRLEVVLSITMDSTPWTTLPAAGFRFGLSFLEFSMAVAGRGSNVIRAVAWSSFLISMFAPLVTPVRALVDLLSVFVLGRSIVRPRDRTAERLLIVGGAVLVLFADIRTNVLGGIQSSPLSRLSGLIRIGPYEINSHPVVLALFTFLMVTVLIRRLLLDREQKQRLADEFEAARTVQQMWLSTSAPAGGEYEIDAIYKPAQEVGGDFYQVLDREDGSRVALVGDVSGKGLKAAMVVSFTMGVLQRESTSSPAALLQAMNDALLNQSVGGGFVTCCCVRFEPRGHVTMANAGHPAPYWNGREFEAEAGLPLGVVKDSQWTETSLILASRDRITLVSDGVVEARNSEGELFGFDRTREISEHGAAEIAEAARAWGQNDDITVVTVRMV